VRTSSLLEPTAALLISTSSLPKLEVTNATAASTEAWSVTSRWRAEREAGGLVAWIEDFAASTFERVRPVMMMWYSLEAPARTWEVARPTPELAPVYLMSVMFALKFGLTNVLTGDEDDG
jgi:hypothetical protein